MKKLILISLLLFGCEKTETIDFKHQHICYTIISKGQNFCYQEFTYTDTIVNITDEEIKNIEYVNKTDSIKEECNCQDYKK